MHMPYGYIRLTEGVDGDHVDCYIGPNKMSEEVFIVHQQVPDTKAYDEDKIMLGYDSGVAAKAAYIRQYDRPGFFQSMEEYDMVEFKQMLKDRKGMKLKKSKKDEGWVIGFDEEDDDEDEGSERDQDFEREHKNEEAKDKRLKKTIEFRDDELDKKFDRTYKLRSEKSNIKKVEYEDDDDDEDDEEIKKSKYIRKFWKNGRWNYIYPESERPKPKPMPGFEARQNLGGTTGGAWLVTMPNGERKVVKHSTTPTHLLEEYTANRIYKILGAPVPRVDLRTTSQGVAQVADFVEGTPLGSLDGESRAEAIESLQRGFVADALLGNWDVLGLDEDNILWDGNKAWRIDNGGSMRYRAQGASKGMAFGDEVGEIETMRDPGRGAGVVFNTVTPSEIVDQIQNVLVHKGTILQAIEDGALRRTMEARIDSLEDYAGFNVVEKSMIPIHVLMKTKYIRRWRGPGGKWYYAYPKDSQEGRPKRTGGESGTLRGMSRADAQRVLKSFRRRGPDEGKEKTVQTRVHLDFLLRESVFCMISAGRNPNDPADAKLSSVQINTREKSLFGDLKQKGYMYTRCRGKYGAPEESIMVMAHDADRGDMMALGAKYNQDSILFADHGKGSLIYTTGAKKGKAEMSGKGHDYVPDADDFYTKMSLADGNNIKFAMRLEEIMKALGWIPNMTLLKSDAGIWHLYENGKLTRFWWFHDLEKAIKVKAYYSPEEVKARGMRWVTIRGARVLIQGTTDGGWVVVGGAGGKLNHLRIENILSKEEYATKRKQIERKRKESLRTLSPEELAEQAKQHRAEVKAKRAARSEYTEAVTKVLGVTPGEIRSEISSKQIDELANKAREMVEARPRQPKDLEAAVEDQTQREIDKAVDKQIKSVERQALETLMRDYMPEDPNAAPSLKKLLDKDKALEVLAARKQFQKTVKEIGKGQADIPTTMRVGDVLAGASSSIEKEILAEVKQNIETQKNIRLYDTLNAQSASIQKHIDQGSISSLNGLVGDLYGVGATFSTDTIENLGLEAVVRAVTIKIQQDGQGEAVRKALTEYAAKEREKVVTEALQESERRFKNADDLRSLARGTKDAEAILSMASANGHALKQLTGGQRALGTAVGSLRAVAAMINALEDPPADVVQVDIGKDLSRARKKAREAGMPKGSYSIKTLKAGRGKRLVLEIKKDSINTFFQRNAEMRTEESLVDRIKMHKENTGYKPPGVAEHIKLDPAQEAGLRFFKEKDKVILDFEAGLGKTAVAYSAAMEAMHNKGAKKVLVVTPAKLRGQMYDERKTFLTDEEQKNVRQANENVSKTDRLARYQKDGIMIVGHDQLRTDAQAIKDAGFDMIVVDEIHEMTSGAGSSGRFKGMMQLKDIPLKIGMSGTNIKNKKNELYRKVNFIDPEHTLGTMQEFDNRYKGLNQGTGMFSDAANDAFRKEIAQWSYTQKNALPVKNDIERFRIPLTSDQRQKYAASERTYRDERNKKLPGAAARRDARNYSIVTNGQAENNAKLNHLVTVMKESHEGEKAVIHVQGLNAMRTAKSRLEKEYGAGTVGLIHGESLPGEVRKAKAAFNDPENPLKFIIGTKSLEAGHNLQGGGTVTFHLDIPDTYAAFDQRNARIFRKGQDRDTKTYVLSGTNPLDMRKEDIMETKRKEMGILGNPRDIEGMDDTGFLGLLNKYEEAESATA